LKVKLDENLPRSAARHLSDAGHDCSTAFAEGLGGAPDPALAAAASAEGRLLVTLDRGLGDLRAHPPGTHPGIVVLRLHDQSAPRVVAVLQRLVEAFDLAAFAGCIAIVEEERVRIRRPGSPSGP